MWDFWAQIRLGLLLTGTR